MDGFEKAYFFQVKPDGKFFNRDSLYVVVGCNVVSQTPHCDEYFLGELVIIFAPDGATAAEKYFDAYAIYSTCFVVPFYFGEFFDNDECGEFDCGDS